MKEINYNTVCIILAVIIVVIIGRAAMNGGKLWGEQENYLFRSRFNLPSPSCPVGQYMNMYGQCM